MTDLSTFLLGFLALPGQPHFEVQVGNAEEPGSLIPVDSAHFEQHKDELVQRCHAFGDAILGSSWRAFMPHVGDNSTLAKLFIGLGEYAGVWQGYPSQTLGPMTWYPDHPRIFFLNREEAPRLVPKPSAGDLEPVGHCECCGRPMGAAGSRHHDLRAEGPGLRRCEECAYEGCETAEGRCRISPGRQPSPKATPRAGGPGEAPRTVDDLDAYVKNLLGQ
jgi:hypothetical protein